MKGDDTQHGSYVRKVTDDARRYAQELLAENEKLRLLLASLESEPATRRHLEARLQAAAEAERGSEALRALVASLESEKVRLQEQLLAAREELEAFRKERAALQRRLAAAEEESRSFSARYAQVEQETSNLANLYVASYRLHGTIERAGVLAVIQEIVANLIGCEELAVFEADTSGSSLSLIASNGIDPAAHETIPFGTGVIGLTALRREVCVLEREAREGARPEERDLTACIPLKLGEKVIGAIALFRLLPQKEQIEPIDHELFDLLATHAATALYCSGLHARLEAATAATVPGS